MMTPFFNSLTKIVKLPYILFHLILEYDIIRNKLELIFKYKF